MGLGEASIYKDRLQRSTSLKLLELCSPLGLTCSNSIHLFMLIIDVNGGAFDSGLLTDGLS